MSKITILLAILAVACIGVIVGALVAGDGDEPTTRTKPPVTGEQPEVTTEQPEATSEDVPAAGAGGTEDENARALRLLASRVTATRPGDSRGEKRAAIADQLRYLAVLDAAGETLRTAADHTAAVARGHRIQRSRALPQRQQLRESITRLRELVTKLDEHSRTAEEAPINPAQRTRVARHRSALSSAIGAAAAQLERQQGLPGLSRAELRAQARNAGRRVRLQWHLALQRAARIARRTSVQLHQTGRQIRVGIRRAVLRATDMGGPAGRRMLRRIYEQLASLPPGWPLFPPLGEKERGSPAPHPKA
jgi:hypothetical protein